MPVRGTTARLHPASCSVGPYPLRPDAPCALPPRHVHALAAVGVRSRLWKSSWTCRALRPSCPTPSCGRDAALATRLQCPSATPLKLSRADVPLRRSGALAGADSSVPDGHGNPLGPRVPAGRWAIPRPLREAAPGAARLSPAEAHPWRRCGASACLSSSCRCAAWAAVVAEWTVVAHLCTRCRACGHITSTHTMRKAQHHGRCPHRVSGGRRPAHGPCIPMTNGGQ